MQVSFCMFFGLQPTGKQSNDILSRQTDNLTSFSFFRKIYTAKTILMLSLSVAAGMPLEESLASHPVFVFSDGT